VHKSLKGLLVTAAMGAGVVTSIATAPAASATPAATAVLIHSVVAAREVCLLVTVDYQHSPSILGSGRETCQGRNQAGLAYATLLGPDENRAHQ